MAKEKDYYDKVDEKEHERSRENSSVPDPTTRDLWQSANVGTDDNGPRVEDVAPVFAQARADALAHPVTADDDDDKLAEDNRESAEEAQAKVDELRENPGYAAPTGEEAGQFDDDSLKGAVPAKNLNVEKTDDKGTAKTAADKKEDDNKSSSSKSTAAKSDDKK